jgi:hypothetical protein
VDVKLPKPFRYIVANTLVVPPFTLTLRDISSDGPHTQAPDLNLLMEGFPRPPFGPNQPTPPSIYFTSGENSKDDTSFPYRRRSVLGTVALDVTLAGWLTDTTDNPGRQDPPYGPPSSEDWHFDLQLDPDFIQRNYVSNLDSLAGAVIPGQPENQICINCCHTIPLTSGQVPDVGTFLMPGMGNMSVELNAWHKSKRGQPDARWQDDPNIKQYPDNLWAFDVQRGTYFPPYQLPPPPMLKAGDYVIVTGTLWEDIGHTKSAGALPIDKCFEDAVACQGGGLRFILWMLCGMYGLPLPCASTLR